MRHGRVRDAGPGGEASIGGGWMEKKSERTTDGGVSSIRRRLFLVWRILGRKNEDGAHIYFLIHTTTGMYIGRSIH